VVNGDAVFQAHGSRSGRTASDREKVHADAVVQDHVTYLRLDNMTKAGARQVMKASHGAGRLSPWKLRLGPLVKATIPLRPGTTTKVAEEAEITAGAAFAIGGDDNPGDPSPGPGRPRVLPDIVASRLQVDAGNAGEFVLGLLATALDVSRLTCGKRFRSLSE
jgi:hypothetical protein